MSTLPGYTLEEGEVVSESLDTVLVRGSRAEDGKHVLVKAPRVPYPPPSAIAKLKAEFEITRELRVPGVLEALRLEHTRHHPALIFEDFAGVSLRRLLAKGPLAPARFLEIAVALSDTLSELHGLGVIHKGLAPESILVDPETGRVKLTDLSLAIWLARERKALGGLDGLEERLAYVSPEQTGRMNRSIDHRSDLYSLGAVFYEMLAGRCCFEAEDPMELVHCHIARQPPSPSQRRPDCPPLLSRIVLKLLAKTVEDRYQSASGLGRDLREASRRLAGASEIEDFALGLDDVPGALSIPAKLYGRERDVEQLLAAVERAARGAALLLPISGGAGIGKSSLVKELERPIVARGGVVASGKFDQLHRDVPYSALVEALRGLIRVLLTEDPPSVSAWKERLLSAVSQSGRLITDLVPELERLIGPQPPVLDLPGAEARARFHGVFERFIAALTSPRRPLVLFLDDMHWADSASLALLGRLLTDGSIGNLLFLCSYRDNEVSPSHPFMLLLAELRRLGRSLVEIRIGPLSAEDIQRLLSDALGSEAPSVEPLARVLLAKTDGNPFFLGQVLRSLYEGGQIRFDAEARRFRWDLSRIERAPHTDNVVALMAEKIQRLPSAVKDALKLAACVGDAFDLGTLSHISESTPAAAAEILREATREGLLVPGGGPEGGQELAREESRYRFVHDRVRQASYALIREDERAAVHLKIGRLLLRKERRPEPHGFDVVNQLNLGRREMVDEAERRAAAELNLAAGRRAKASSAYAAAAGYFRVGCELLGEGGWQSSFDLLWALTVERAECEYLLTNFADAEAAFDLGLSHARTRLQMAQVYKVKIILYTNLGRYLDACLCGVEALRHFGIDFPETDDGVRAALLRQDIPGKLRGRRIEELVDLPEETDPARLSLGMLLAHLISPFFNGFATTEREALVTSILVSQVLSTGRNSDAGTYGFACYANQLVDAGDFANGFAFGKLSLEAAEKHSFNMSKGRNYTLFGGVINHWVRPATTSSAYLLRAIQLLRESGDVIYAVYSCSNLITVASARGDSLDQVDEEIQRYSDFVRQSKFQDQVSTLEVHRQLLQCLKGQTSSPWLMPPLDAGAGLRPRALWHLSQMKLHYMAGRYADAVLAGIEAERLIPVASTSTLLVPESRFYYALSIAAHGRGPSGEEPGERIRPIAEAFGIWAASCPENFRQQLLLIEAELSRLAGRDLSAMRLYDEAIDAAGESSALPVEALGNELSARFHLHGGRDRVARSYLYEAHHAYTRWGATAKAAELKATYPEAFGPASSSGGLALQLGGSGLDLLTVTKSSQVLSGEIHLRSLLEKLIRIVMENAGSERAVLLLARDGGWFIEAEATVDHAEATLLQSIPLEATQALPKSVINYVAHTDDCLVLGNAMASAPYQLDPYVAAREARSILCLPVIAHKSRVGILYLEHNRATDVFTSERRHVLTLLSAQAAISIENALLYHTLEQRVEDRTQKLNAKNEELAAALRRLHETQRLLVEKEKLASLGAVTSGVAHEIKNPLNFINNFSEVARGLAEDLRGEVGRLSPSPSEKGLAEAMEMAEQLVMLTSKIGEHGKRVDRIVSAMGKHSASASAARRHVDLNQLLERHVAAAREELGALASAPEVTLTARYDDTIGLVRAAPDELGQVFANLIKNAWQAALTRHRSAPIAPPEVLVSSRSRGARVEVSVRDNGAGISPEDRDKIFNPFFTTKSPREGTGLGLSLSYTIVVHLHGGELRFDSEPGRGAEFVVSLPRS